MQQYDAYVTGPAPIKCVICLKPSRQVNGLRLTCSAPCTRKYQIALSRARREFVQMRERLLPYIAGRDGGRCQICGKPVRARKGPRRASVDHIVPLSRGGTNDLVNLQLAHLSCNLLKGNRRGGDQLLLFG